MPVKEPSPSPSKGRSSSLEVRLPLQWLPQRAPAVGDLHRKPAGYFQQVLLPFSLTESILQGKESRIHPFILRRLRSFRMRRECPFFFGDRGNSVSVRLRRRDSSAVLTGPRSFVCAFISVFRIALSGDISVPRNSAEIPWTNSVLLQDVRGEWNRMVTTFCRHTFL